MPIEVLMPALSPTMEEGTLAKWHKAVGDTVEAGDVIAEIETDKATMEVEAVDEGTMGKHLVAEGTEGVKVNTVIALLLEEGEDASALESAGGAPAAAAPASAPAEAAPVEAAPEPAKAEAAAPARELAVADGGAPAAAPAAPAPTGGGGQGGGGQDGGGRVFASPLARRMAQQAGLDLSGLSGSGPKGRIVKLDIEAALARAAGKPARPAADAGARPAAPLGAPASGPVERGPESYEEISLSNVRKVIAKRLTEADRDVPQFYLTVDCEVDNLLAARKQINEAADGAYKVSVNDFVIKAAAIALRRAPDLNAQWAETAIRRFNTVDISVAVAYEGGLITPIVFDADRKGLAQISQEMIELSGRAREGKLKPEEFQGGTFSISNLGMFGIKDFTAVINPPQGAILAVGAGEQRPVVKNGELTIATMMSVTLTCDHRIADGALGAQWIQAFKKLIETPATMLA